MPLRLGRVQPLLGVSMHCAHLYNFIHSTLFSLADDELYVIQNCVVEFQIIVWFYVLLDTI